MAETNIASIAYHFGGKEGLRTACAEHIVEVMDGVLERMPQAAIPPDPAAARMMLTAVVRRFVGFLLLDPRARPVAGFVLREMAEPSPALDLIYERLFESVHTRACAIWGVATGRDPESAGSAARGLLDHRADRLLQFRPPGDRAPHGLARHRPGRGRGDRRHHHPEPRCPARRRPEGKDMTGFLCALPLVAGLLGCPAPDVLAVGYVEGDYVRLAPVSAAELVEVAVRQGDRVEAGQVVARQERTDAEIALAEAEAARQQAGGGARQSARGQPAGGDRGDRGGAGGRAGAAPRGASARPSGRRRWPGATW